MQLPSIDNLSIEEIEQLLPQLQDALKKAEQVPINETVSQRFQEEWELVDLCLKQTFEEEMDKSHDNLFLFTSLETVLNSFIGEDNSKIFFNIANKCLSENSFRYSQAFYAKVNDNPIRTIARISFNVLQLNLALRRPGDIKSAIKECMKDPDYKVQEVCAIYQQLGLISF